MSMNTIEAVVETFFFFIVMFDLVASQVGVEIKRKNIFNTKLWLIIFGIAITFTAFHIAAKGLILASMPVLALVFFMAVISMVLVTYFESGIHAVWFHVIANGLAIGLIPFNIGGFL